MLSVALQELLYGREVALPVKAALRRPGATNLVLSLHLMVGRKASDPAAADLPLDRFDSLEIDGMQLDDPQGTVAQGDRAVDRELSDRSWFGVVVPELEPDPFDGGHRRLQLPFVSEDVEVPVRSQLPADQRVDSPAADQDGLDAFSFQRLQHFQHAIGGDRWIAVHELAEGNPYPPRRRQPPHQGVGAIGDPGPQSGAVFPPTPPGRTSKTHRPESYPFLQA
jgi:hypothetical protein